MIRIRSGRGVGDSIYLRPIAEHLARRGNDVVALSDHPDVFIGAGVEVLPFVRERVDVIAHYAMRRENPTTTQFEDMLAAAQITEPVALEMCWTIRNARLVDELQHRAAGRPIILVHGGREPFGRSDGLGLRMVPDRRAFETALAQLRDCFTVGIGKGDRIYEIPVEWSLHGLTTVSELLDLGRSCDGVLGQCSFAVPLAEVFDKPLLVSWSAVGLGCGHHVLKLITPRKILQKKTSGYFVDNWSPSKITASVDAFGASLREKVAA